MPARAMPTWRGDPDTEIDGSGSQTSRGAYPQLLVELARTSTPINNSTRAIYSNPYRNQPGQPPPSGVELNKASGTYRPSVSQPSHIGPQPPISIRTHHIIPILHPQPGR